MRWQCSFFGVRALATVPRDHDHTPRPAYPADISRTHTQISDESSESLGALCHRDGQPDVEPQPRN